MRRLVTFLAAALISTGLLMSLPRCAIGTGEGDGRFVTTWPDQSQLRLFVSLLDSDGPPRRRFVDDAGCPTWSPRADAVLVCWLTLRGVTRPAVVDARGEGLRVLDHPDKTLSLECWAWSRGDRLACSGSDDVHANSRRGGVYTVPASDGLDLKRVTSNPYVLGLDVPGDFSSDGAKIVFRRSNPTASDALFVVNSDGTGLKRLTPWTPLLSTGDFSPNGELILYSVSKRLWVVRPDGRGLREIKVTVPQGQLDGIFVPRWSPDGHHVAFVASATVDLKITRDLYTVSGSGGTARLLAATNEAETSFDWAPASSPPARCD